MFGKSLPNPCAVPDELDYIHAPDLATPNWSENLFFWCHDGEANIAVFAHLSRLTPNPEMWEGVTAVLLPNGRVIIDRSIGHSPLAADCGPMRFDCIEPNRRWRLRYSGTAQETGSAALANGDYHPDAPVALDMELHFDAVNPVWSLGAEADQQDWASFHTQQGGSVSGVIEINGKKSNIDCGGFRDHSAGPRSYDGLVGNFWACCVFPSGRSFMAFKVWSEHLQQPMSRGFIATPDSLDEVTVIEAPDLAGPDASPHDTRIVLQHGEHLHKIIGRGDTSITFHLTRPVGMRFGFRADEPGTCIDTHLACRYTMGEETGYGWLERIRRNSYFLGQEERLE